jgi:hypothetical protein
MCARLLVCYKQKHLKTTCLLTSLPEEAELLKSRGGSGMPDPQTGIPTYYVPDPEYALTHMLFNTYEVAC